jgi:dipeptidyl aminopeptidase/acylaminoacyl peptidase
MKRLILALVLILVLVAGCVQVNVPQESTTTLQKQTSGTTVKANINEPLSEGRILHLGMRTMQSRVLWMINSDGTGVEQVLNKYVPAKWSPNGEKILYLISNKLFIMDPSSTFKKEIVEGNDPITDFYWSSDSKYVYYQAGKVVGVVHLDNWLIVKLTNDQENQQQEGSSPTYSEKDTIAFVFGKNIYKTDVDATSTEEFMNLASPSNLKASPDGMYLAFNNNGEFYIAPNKRYTQDLTVVSESSAVYYAWSPDANMIAYRTGEGSFYIYNVETKTKKKVEKNSQDNFAWSPDSKWIAFTFKSPDAYENIWVVKADGTGLKQFTDCTTACEKPNWG